MVSIFHASDLTEAGAHAFRHALRLAVGDGNKLTIMHVHGKGEKAKGWKHYPHVRETLDRWGLTREHATAGTAVRKVEAEGNSISGALSHHISRHQTDLVVMASEGREGLAGFLKQSVAHRVVQKSKTPALVLPNGCKGFIAEDGSITLDSVLVAVARKPDPQLAVDAAAWLARLAGAQLRRFTAVHVGPKPVAVALPQIAGASSEAMPGEPVSAILRAASIIGAGLIVMTTEGRKGFRENFTGSTTEQVCAKADCPVLILPAPDYRTAPAV